MKVTIVVDNIEHAGIPGEWGFCAYIEQNGKKLLLDTGASNLFADNAEKLNIDLKDEATFAYRGRYIGKRKNDFHDGTAACVEETRHAGAAF